MPRTGGVYNPPAGTKGVPNTTILSNAYNSFVDDLTADANAARPITAGGTGSTSASAARTALGLAIGTNVQAYDAGLQSISGLTTVANQMLYTTASDAYATTALTPFARTILDDADAATMRATMGADNATNLILGTISDARLPTTMAAKSFTTQAYIDGATNAHLWFRKAGVNRGIVFTDDANDRFIFRKYDTAGVADGELALWGAGATELKHTGNTVWTAANDGAGSTLDADLLDGQQGAYYLSAPNLTGTISDARLPTTMAGKTFSSAVTISAGLAATAGGYFIIQPTDYGAGKPALFFNRDAATTYRISTYDGVGNAGTINIATGSFLFNGNTVWSSGNDGAGSGLDADTIDGVHLSGIVQTSRTITAGTGLSGGGDLSANRSLSVSYGTAAGTAAQGNDSRIVNAVPNTRSVTAGTGLTGGGTLAADRTLAVSYGTAAGTAAQGNDSRIVNAVPNTRTVTAGNGMTGGGALNANITVTLGTPLSITNSSTNTVGATNHGHALGFVAAEVYTGSAIGELNYPVGTVLLFDGYHDMNQLINLYYNSGNSRNLNYSGVGTLVAGSWRMRGSFTSPQFGLCQRVA